MSNKAITISVITDAMGILSDDSVEGNVYLFDNNRIGGSTGEGTSSLQCRVDCGNEKETVTSKLLWNITNLCPDVRVDLVGVTISGDVIEVEKRLYDDTDIAYWVGTVIKSFDAVKCTLSIRVAESSKIYTVTFTIRGRKEERQ